MAREIIHLEDFQHGFEREVNGIKLSSGLVFEPYVPTDEVLVDLSRISGMARVARLSAVSFARRTDSRDSIIAGVDSVSSDGTATVTSAKTASKQKRSTTEQEEFIAPYILKMPATVKLNLGHEDLDKKPLRDPNNWARVLDLGIKNGIKDAGLTWLSMSRGRRLFYGGIMLTSLGLDDDITQQDFFRYSIYGNLLPIFWAGASLLSLRNN